jgi:hypothetical protein
MSVYKKYNRGGGTWGTEGEAYDIKTVPSVFRENNLTYNVFPNIVTPADSGGFPFIIFWPTGLFTTEVEWITVGQGDDTVDHDPAGYWTKFHKTYDDIMQEDLQFLADIQKSLNSGGFTGVMLSYMERRLYWVQEEIDRRIGAERIRADHRVTQVLSPYAEA